MRTHRHPRATLLSLTVAALYLLAPIAFAQMDPTDAGIEPGGKRNITPPSVSPSQTPVAETPASAGWKRAIAPWKWSFPADHGAHPDFRTEWWYFTGHLQEANSINDKDIPTSTPIPKPDPLATGTQPSYDPDVPADGTPGGAEYLRVDKVVGDKKPDGRRFGFQFTLFRYGLQFTPVQVTSKWAVRDVMFGHMALTDLNAKRFYFGEILDRGALNQAGASTKEMKAWIRNWRIETVGPEEYRVRGETPEFGMDMVITPRKKLVLQGAAGLSQKAEGAGNASYYYSYTRMTAAGWVRINATQYLVRGESWFDHEFSTGSLGKDQIGWDWFSIQLDNDEELMLYEMRRADGKRDPRSKGILVRADGTTLTLGVEDFKIETLARWRSPGTGGDYPSKWKISVPKAGLELESTAAVADQELRLRQLSRLNYWEGVCNLTGTREGKPVTGRGYTELTGYASPLGEGMR
ncbi:carotenoid 1,2-hydratase [Verrucomicrobia bacterium LW23]|nr:carotenoid 1,2-hydratase [Verrucomicrobia bacterium LW23]